MAYEVGDQFLFDARPIHYWQDFSAWYGMLLPSVWLTLEEFTHDGRYATLCGPGYGEHGNYGNGAIHVAIASLDNAVEYRPAPDLLAAYKCQP